MIGTMCMEDRTMPLRNHDDPSEAEWKPWIGFNTAWACTMLGRLNLEVFSKDYRADLDVHKPHFSMPTFEAIPDHTISTINPDIGFPPASLMSAMVEFAEPRSCDLIVH